MHQRVQDTGGKDTNVDKIVQMAKPWYLVNNNVPEKSVKLIQYKDSNENVMPNTIS